MILSTGRLSRLVTASLLPLKYTELRASSRYFVTILQTVLLMLAISLADGANVLGSSSGNDSHSQPGHTSQKSAIKNDPDFCLLSIYT